MYALVKSLNIQLFNPCTYALACSGVVPSLYSEYTKQSTHIRTVMPASGLVVIACPFWRCLPPLYSGGGGAVCYPKRYCKSFIRLCVVRLYFHWNSLVFHSVSPVTVSRVTIHVYQRLYDAFVPFTITVSRCDTFFALPAFINSAIFCAVARAMVCPLYGCS